MFYKPDVLSFLLSGERHDTLSCDSGGRGARGTATEHRRRRCLRDRVGWERQSAALLRCAVRGGRRRGHSGWFHHTAGHQGCGPWPAGRHHRSNVRPAATGESLIRVSARGNVPWKIFLSGLCQRSNFLPFYVGFSEENFNRRESRAFLIHRLGKSVDRITWRTTCFLSCFISLDSISLRGALSDKKREFFFSYFSSSGDRVGA